MSYIENIHFSWYKPHRRKKEQDIFLFIQNKTINWHAYLQNATMLTRLYLPWVNAITNAIPKQMIVV